MSNWSKYSMRFCISSSESKSVIFSCEIIEIENVIVQTGATPVKVKFLKVIDGSIYKLNIHYIWERKLLRNI